MTDRVSLEAAVRNEPDGFEDRIDEIHERLASADPHASADAGRTFRAVAEERPVLLETHRETLVDLLSADNGSLRLSGALGLAGLADPSPETVTEAVPELVALLERTDAPAVQMAILRALSSVADVRDRVETLRTRQMAQPWHADDTLERAARTLRAIDTRR